MVLIVAISACTSSVSQTTTTAPRLPSTTSTQPTATTTTSTVTTTTRTEPTVISVAYGVNGSGRLRSMWHLEVFAYPDDASSENHPTEVMSDDFEMPADGRVLFEGSMTPGVAYEVRSFQRTCAESCEVLEPPTNGCATRVAALPGSDVRVTIVDSPGSGCEMVVDGATQDQPERTMALTLEQEGQQDCDPASPISGPGLTETLGTSTGAAVGWGLLWSQPPFPVGRLTKMVFRLTGEGAFDVKAIHDDGTMFGPQWGPNEHGSGNVSSYARPGNEWGMAFSFPNAGCWNIHFTIGGDTIDFWLPVED